MPDSNPPHGGVAEPLDCQVPQAEQADFRRRAAELKKVTLSDADLSTLGRMGDGGLTPLTGPMDRETFNRVLDEEVVGRGGKKYAWTIPLSFPIDRAQANSLKQGDNVALVNGKNDVVGTLQITDIFPFEKQRYLKVVYGTERTDHPGGKMVLSDPREMLLGGTVRVLPQPKHSEYGKFVLSPRETRALFGKMGW